MWQSRCKVLLSLSGMIVSALTLAACASDATYTPLLASATNQEETVAAQAALPPNFRTLVAEYIRRSSSYPIQDAKITPPYQRWGGLGSVEIHREFITAAARWMFAAKL
jgi:hypothetical protein